MTRDEELIIICALRYALPRNTYMPSVVADYIIDNLSKYSDKFIKNILDNIDTEIKWSNRMNNDHDIKTWLNLKEKLNKSLDNKKIV